MGVSRATDDEVYVCPRPLPPGPPSTAAAIDVSEIVMEGTLLDTPTVADYGVEQVCGMLEQAMERHGRPHFVEAGAGGESEYVAEARRDHACIKIKHVFDSVNAPKGALWTGKAHTHVDGLSSMQKWCSWL